MNWEVLDVPVVFRKGRGARDQIANIRLIIEKSKEFQKIICFFFIDCTEAFDFEDHNKLWKFLKKTGMPDYLTCFLRNLYLGQEATSRTRHGKMDGSKLGKTYIKAIYCHPPYLIYM